MSPRWWRKPADDIVPTRDEPGAAGPLRTAIDGVPETDRTPEADRVPEMDRVPEPWVPIEVDEPGPIFEARPPIGPDCYDFPDTECDGWSTPDLTLRYASVRGARHRFHQQPRQDSARAALHQPSGTIVFAVADGVSSATLAHRGAHEVCGFAIHRMLKCLTADPNWGDWHDLAQRCAGWMAELTRRRQGEAHPAPHRIAELYATTLVAGLIWPHADGPAVELCRIGDSDAWILDHSTGRYYPLFRSGADAHGDVVSTAVTPLPHVPERVERAAHQLTPTQVLLVGTDGFGLPLGDGDGLIGDLFARQLETPPAPTWLAHVLDFSRATFDDDRTLLAVWPRSPSRPQ
ncbi:protein phosphatase 2C domain-containing protein [Nocardia sp. CDC153]|uniref:protein phosphatase 2C domain-containing protein n=1 Tax=Nocardia sp. CDC153 TaxID=3112167 RepID=UPI002DB70BBE|nr:protein phosphatase 2C domain-containing protein [Nocardia sp. CDC153]MEC3954178.1 protein phosphatase 2C domain-containing protein [Nocardia sp. CDC153]